MELSVIIVNYNVKYFLEQCLESLFPALDLFGESEVLVVDNTSSDGSQAYITSRITDPRLKWIGNTENVGFGRANNQALAQATGMYVLFLNPDTVVSVHSLIQCHQAMLRQPDVAAIGLRLMTANGAFLPESMRGFPDPFTSFCKITNLYRLFPRVKRFNRYYLSWLDNRESHLESQVQVLPGAFIFASHACLDRLDSKGFDERFFMYGEDIDLSVRLLKTGHIAYLPQPLLHYKGESTNHNSSHYVKVFYEAMSLFQKKYYPRRYLLNAILDAGIRLAAFMSNRKRRFWILSPAEEQRKGFLIYSSALSVPHILTLLKRHGHTPEEYTRDAVDLPLSEICQHVCRTIDKQLYEKNYFIFDISLYGYSDLLSLLSENPLEEEGEVIFYSSERGVLLFSDGSCYA